MGNSYLELKKEVEASKIRIISAYYDDNRPENVPENHREKFRCVQQLGGQNFHDYCPQPTMNPTAGPWQRERKNTAQYIFDKASKCKEERLNEDGWRESIEYCVFKRFSTEVNCKACSKRLWRSEIEQDPEKNNNLLGLSQRQANREACECNPTTLQIDCTEVGIFEMFTTRISEFVIHEKTPPGSGKIELKPDRIIGLRETSTVKQLLGNPYVHGEPEGPNRPVVGKLVNSSINPDKGGSQLLFPFLVLEAKTDMAPQGFDHAEVQSALPVMKALRLQHDLMKIPGNTVEVLGGPLVWFFVNRGEDWRVYAAYVVENNEETSYWIRCLWGGCMNSLNHALQLLLIVDSIIDWARDSYRLNVFFQLKMLSRVTLDPANFSIDEDVYSVRNFRKVNSWNQARNLEPVEDDDEPTYWNGVKEDVEEDKTLFLDRFGTAHGVVRDATRIDSHLLGLMLTKENFHILEASFDCATEARELAKQILETLGERSLLLPGRSALDKVENLWVGPAGSPPTGIHSEMDTEKSVYAQFRVSYFIDHEWHQVRQLNYLAVTEEALADIQVCAGVRQLPLRLRKEFASQPERIEESLLAGIKATLEDRTVQKDLKAALNRQVFYLEEAEVLTKVLDENGYRRAALCPTVQKKLDLEKGGAGAGMQRLVHTTHERFRIGQLSLPQPFLISSLRVDVNTRLLRPGYTKDDRIPHWQYYITKVLVHARTPEVRPHHLPLDQQLCLYIMDGTVDEQSFVSIATYLRAIDADNLLYITARRDRVNASSSDGIANRESRPLKLGDPQPEASFIAGLTLFSIVDWYSDLEKRK